MRVEQTNDQVTLLPYPLKPESKITLTKADIEEFEASNVSTMPMSFLLTFTCDEILDLLAIVQSGGNQADAEFQTAQ